MPTGTPRLQVHEYDQSILEAFMEDKREAAAVAVNNGVPKEPSLVILDDIITEKNVDRDKYIDSIFTTGRCVSISLGQRCRSWPRLAHLLTAPSTCAPHASCSHFDMSVMLATQEFSHAASPRRKANATTIFFSFTDRDTLKSIGNKVAGTSAKAFVEWAPQHIGPARSKTFGAIIPGATFPGSPELLPLLLVNAVPPTDMEVEDDSFSAPPVVAALVHPARQPAVAAPAR